MIPGNELAIGRLHNELAKLGVEIVTEQDHFVHVSGHPARDELARKYAHVRPRAAVPVHGEVRHLTEHARLARECQVPHALVAENGDVVRLAPGIPAVIDKVPVGRIRSIAEAARDTGRQLVVLGRSLKRVIDVATELGYLDDLPSFIAEEDFGYIPREHLVILCTGSQGEPRAALAKLARGEMRNVTLAAGDTVVYSSRVIPGNEKAILETKNLLIEQGVRVVEDSDALVHVSGHPRRSELRRMYEWTRPQILVPVHGEAAHLVAQGALGAEAGIPHVAQIRNGDMLRLAPGAPQIVDQVPYGRIFKDGRLLGDDEAMGIRERRKLAFAGHVAVNVVLDDRFDLAGDPDLSAFGVPKKDATGEEIEEVMIDAVVEAVDSIPRVRRKDLELVSEAVRRAVRAAANQAWGKKPVVTVFVTR
jgi:ribonuclease J